MNDYNPGDTIYFKFTTRGATGPAALTGSPALTAYKDNDTTQDTSGISLTVDFDGVTGLNHVTIDTSTDPTFYSENSSFELVFTSGTVEDNSVAGEIAGRFALRNLNAYQAKVWIVDDNGGATDRYITIWHKNGEPLTTGITSPTIQVIKVADGTDLVASTAMTQIAATGLYRYSEGTNRIVNGVAYIAKVEATIDGSTRTWYQPLSRDS